ncbi:2-amino-4-hydroxy-6-hydroxymethyldihydropteridine diphosphokinase [Blattabacterium cuenoti]|uniref:2-amino-4-hydroxy-6- hydroxymethyldihydropteridine diphosphokinase n=1 Tax=Blattabacterium cuenoti TaxID=1653831 RepID=UPI00163CE969|nr:2-amino-4-hydroxy-6-hydroxymethyldihydropteridine diphosphokinase [Blattabacterium cuenoti]
MQEHNIFLLQGSNKENREINIEKSLALIADNIGTIIKKSSYFESQAWNMSNNTYSFYNRALHIRTHLTPMSIIQEINKIELSMGRKKVHHDKKIKKYQDREIDIDIIFYDNIIIYSSILTIPHPLFHLRRFALEPMCDIAPNKNHPVFNIRVIEILGLCLDKSKIEKL